MADFWFHSKTKLREAATGLDRATRPGGGSELFDTRLSTAHDLLA